MHRIQTCQIRSELDFHIKCTMPLATVQLWILPVGSQLHVMLFVMLLKLHCNVTPKAKTKSKNFKFTQIWLKLLPELDLSGFAKKKRLDLPELKSGAFLRLDPIHFLARCHKRLVN